MEKVKLFHLINWLNFKTTVLNFRSHESWLWMPRDFISINIREKDEELFVLFMLIEKDCSTSYTNAKRNGLLDTVLAKSSFFALNFTELSDWCL